MHGHVGPADQGVVGRGGFFLEDIAAVAPEPPVVERCVFASNTAANFGGAIYNTVVSSAKYWNCRFHGNVCGTGGGGVALAGGAAGTVVNCVFSGNFANTFGGGAVSMIAVPAATVLN